ncbi:MAG: CYTH domain-containing protein [Phascolarctobacterium sp.]|nr:CYTH domain-containing protein [Candidatus Phascolarctobacterium caballi]
MEIELKVVLTEENLQKLLNSELFIRGIVPNSEQVLLLTSNYYDTDDFALHTKGEVYRVRITEFADGHKEYESTTKRTLKNNGGLAEREEINVKQNDEKPCYANVKKIFATEVTRKILLLKYNNALFEMAIDKGRIVAANGKTDPIDEVEFEIKKGTTEDLQKLRVELQKIVPLQEEARSKYARGLALVGKIK